MRRWRHILLVTGQDGQYLLSSRAITWLFLKLYYRFLLLNASYFPGPPSERCVLHQLTVAALLLKDEIRAAILVQQLIMDRSDTLRRSELVSPLRRLVLRGEITYAALQVIDLKRRLTLVVFIVSGLASSRQDRLMRQGISRISFLGDRATRRIWRLLLLVCFGDSLHVQGLHFTNDARMMARKMRSPVDLRQAIGTGHLELPIIAIHVERRASLLPIPTVSRRSRPEHAMLPVFVINILNLRFLENGRLLFTRIFFGLRLIPDLVRVVHLTSVTLLDHLLCFLNQDVCELSVECIGQLLSLLGGEVLEELG